MWDEVVCSNGNYDTSGGLPGAEGWDYCLFEDLLPYEEGYIEIESSGVGFGTEAIAGMQIRGDVSSECTDPYDCPYGEICSPDSECVDIPEFILDDPDPAIGFDLLVEDQEAGFVIGYSGAAGELAARQIYWIFPDGFDLNDPGPEGTVVGTVDVDINGDETPEALYNIVVGGTSSEGTVLYYVDYDGDWEIDPREPRIAASTGCIIINIIVPYGGSRDTLDRAAGHAYHDRAQPRPDHAHRARKLRGSNSSFSPLTRTRAIRTRA